MKDIDFSMTLGKDNVLYMSRKDLHLQFIDDTISELECWACFHENKGYFESKAFAESNLYTTYILLQTSLNLDGTIRARMEAEKNTRSAVENNLLCKWIFGTKSEMDKV